jgi:hypothetical protein
MTQHGFWDGTQIVADGYSEGAQVVPALAVADKRVTHIVAIVGSGLNQLYDGIMAWRIKAAKAEISHQQAQDSINANLKIIKDIYLHPDNTTMDYEGQLRDIKEFYELFHCQDSARKRPTVSVKNHAYVAKTIRCSCDKEV